MICSPNCNNPTLQVCNALLKIAAFSVSDFPLLNLVWKYTIKLTVKHRSEDMDELLNLSELAGLLSSGVVTCFSHLIDSHQLDVKAMNRQIRIIQFYLTHLTTIIIEYGNLVIKNILRAEVSHDGDFGGLKNLMFFVGSHLFRLSPSPIIKAIQPSLDGIVRAIFITAPVTDADRYKLIRLWFDEPCSQPRMCDSRHLISQANDVRKSEIAVAKVVIMEFIIRQFDDLSQSLQRCLLCGIPSDGTLKRDGDNKSFCFLRIFLSLLDDLPPMLFFLSHPDECWIPQEESDEYNPAKRHSALYIHSLTSLIMLAHLITPELFMVWERCTIEALMCARNTVVPVLVAQCWSVVGKTLLKEARETQINALLHLMSKTRTLYPVTSRLRRLLIGCIRNLTINERENLIAALPSTGECYNVDDCFLWYSFPFCEFELTAILIKVTTQVFDRCMGIWRQLGEILIGEGDTINIDVLHAMHVPIECISNVIVKRSDDIQEKLQTVVEFCINCLRDSAELIKNIGSESGDQIVERGRKFRQVAITVNALVRLLIVTSPHSGEQILQMLQILKTWLSLSEPHFLISRVAICNLLRKCAFVDVPDEFQQPTLKLLSDIVSTLFREARWLSLHELFQFIVDYAASGKYPDFVQEAVPETLHRALMDFIDQKPYQPTEQLSTIDETNAEMDFFAENMSASRKESPFMMSIKNMCIATEGKLNLDTLVGNMQQSVSPLECGSAVRVIQGFLQSWQSDSSNVDANLQKELKNLTHTLTTWFRST